MNMPDLTLESLLGGKVTNFDEDSFEITLPDRRKVIIEATLDFERDDSHPILNIRKAGKGWNAPAPQRESNPDPEPGRHNLVHGIIASR